MQAVLNAIRIQLRKDSLSTNNSSLEAKVNRSIVFSFAVRFLSIAVTFLFIPLAIKTLSKHEFGIWMVLFSLVNWLIIVETAVINFLRNELIECFVSDNTDRARQVMASALCTALVVAGSISVGAVCAYKAGLISPLLQLLSVDFTGVDQVFLVVIIGYVLQIIVKLYNGVLLADHKVHLSSSILLICNVISFLVIMLLDQLHINSLLAFSVVQSFAPIAVYGLFFGYGFSAHYSRFLPTKQHWRRADIRSVLSRSGNFLVLQLASVLMFTSGSLIVARYFTATEVTTYAVVAKYYSLIPTIYAIVITPYWSAFSEAYLKQDRRWITDTMHRLHLYCGAALGIALVLLIADNTVCRIWLNNSIQIPLGLSLAFTIYSVAYVLLSNYNYYTNAIGKLRLATIMSVLGCVFFFPLNYLFVEILDFGLPGVVWVSTCWCVLLTLCCRYEYRKSLATL